MIRVKIDLEPYGMTIGGKTLAEIRIWNATGRGLSSTHTYEYEIYEPSPISGSPIKKHGTISKYDRMQPVVNLVQKVLQDSNVKAN